MVYDNMACGVFVDRPNRFIAHVIVDGQVQVCHVKNTGRCRELLTPGAEVYVQRAANPDRKTKYDLIAVKKGDLLINMDAAAPNTVAGEYLPKLFPDIRSLRPETVFGQSRLDFMAETDSGRLYVEVKGVTLERDGVAMFPDAPTERGVKHLRELVRCVEAGHRAAVLFIVQMKPVRCMMPNDGTHPQFGEALRFAKNAGVTVAAVDCIVTPDSITADEPVEVVL